MDSARLKQIAIICGAFSLISMVNYSRLSGTENVRPIVIFSLLTTGALLGMFIFATTQLFKLRRK